MIDKFSIFLFCGLLSISSNGFAETTLGLKHPDVFILGESEHNSRYSHRLLELVIEQALRESDFDCLILELGRDLNESLNAWTTGKAKQVATSDKTLQKIFAPLTEEPDRSAMGILQVAKSRGRKIFGADLAQADGAFEPVRKAYLELAQCEEKPEDCSQAQHDRLLRASYERVMNSRDREMSENLSALLKRECRRAILIGGSAHFSRVTEAEKAEYLRVGAAPRKTVQDRLKESGVTNIAAVVIGETSGEKRNPLQVKGFILDRKIDPDFPDHLGTIRTTR